MDSGDEESIGASSMPLHDGNAVVGKRNKKKKAYLDAVDGSMSDLSFIIDGGKATKQRILITSGTNADKTAVLCGEPTVGGWSLALLDKTKVMYFLLIF